MEATHSWYLFQWRPGADEVQDELVGILLHPRRDVSIDLPARTGRQPRLSARHPRGLWLWEGAAWQVQGSRVTTASFPDVRVFMGE